MVALLLVCLDFRSPGSVAQTVLTKRTANQLKQTVGTNDIDAFIIESVNGHGSCRAAADDELREDVDLRNAEFNRAFVLMQYFGYLRRDPNALPDTNFDGYNFWLNKLDSFGGNFVNAEMVKAFISSIEYKQRFGP